MVGLGKLEQTVVNQSAVESIVKDGEIKENDTFEFAHRIETGTGTQAFVVIFAVSEELELMDDAAGDDKIIADEAGLGDSKKARIHEGGSVDIEFALLVSGNKGFLTGFENQNR